MSSAAESIDVPDPGSVAVDGADAQPLGTGETPPEADAAPSPDDEDVGVEPAVAAEDDASGEETQPSEIVAALTGLERRLEGYERLLTRHADVASRLHSENQELKKGEFRQAQTSLVLGVLRVIDDISQMAETAEEAARSDLRLIGESLRDTLEGYGVERLPMAVGDDFDGKAHKIAKVQPTQDEALNRTLADIRRPGFAWVDGTTIRVAEVVVYKFVPAREPACESVAQEPPAPSAADDAPDPPA